MTNSPRPMTKQRRRTHKRFTGAGRGGRISEVDAHCRARATRMFPTWMAAGMAGLLLLPGGGAEGQADYTELSRRLQQAAVEKCPKFFEDRSQWGRTVPIPPEVRFPRLRRTVVQVK